MANYKTSVKLLAKKKSDLSVKKKVVKIKESHWIESSSRRDSGPKVNSQYDMVELQQIFKHIYFPSEGILIKN